MRSPRTTILLIVLAVALLVGWPYVLNLIWPPKPSKPHQETVTLAMGGMASGDESVRKLKRVGKIEEEPAKAEEEPKKDPVVKKDPEVKAKPLEIKADPNFKPSELIALGHGGDRPFYLQVLLNTHGGSVQQVIVTEFPEATREGLEVIENGKPKPLHLIPGVRVPRAPTIRGQANEPIPKLAAGSIGIKELEGMSAPSYVMYHYDKPGDERPLLTLGAADWKPIEVSNVDPNEQKVVFQTELGEPHNLIIAKTYTLKSKEYHLGLTVDIKRKPGTKGPNQFRYQMSGPVGLPIEGEWYTSTFRQAIVGFSDKSGSTTRYIEDAQSVRTTEGGDRQTRTNKLAINFAAVAVQYFASGLAVDDQQEKRDFIEFVRATPEGATHKDKNILDDVTVRAITEAFNPDDGGSHKYMLYNGPVKVRLLRQLPKDKAVDGALVDRYLDKLHLDTLTDSHMPNAIGRFASAIYWSDLVIAFTNLIHSLLWAINQVVPSLALCIVILTIIVRAILFPMSRRQAHNGQVMQAKMAKLQPELKKLQEKYGSDFQRFNAEKIKLFKEHGVNPFAAMGGCLLLLVQMPVMMGLYYALQESVFFRLESFLWIPNLAAPDMLVFWGEKIPYISAPNDFGSMIYLGPYFNVLPILAVLFMLVQQKAMMPQSDDPQVQAQQRMMKFMMIFMGLFFYKVAAGLCIYFICGSLWGMLERKFFPKTKKPGEGATSPNGQEYSALTGKNDEKPEVERPLGWFGRRKAHFKEKWKDVLEQAQKQAEHRRNPQEQPPNDASDRAKRRKKKRK